MTLPENRRPTKAEGYLAWVEERVQNRRDLKGDEAANQLAQLLTRVRPVDQIGDYVNEEDDPNILIYGGWLERGCAAAVISTSGTGKSSHCMQLVHSMAAGVAFAGLRPRGKQRVWVYQTEDSERRIERDRLDVRAELAEQFAGQVSEEEWEDASKRVCFCEVRGSGVEFLRQLYEDLTLARLEEQLTGKKTLPDSVVLNPFLAFIGGPINDSAYVTPFLRGGKVDREVSIGISKILREFNIGLILYHHTAKPPPEKDLKAWVNSAFSEYQGAGSSDLTNFVRSVIVMQKVFGHYDWRILTASKNGSDLDWERLNDVPRYFIAYSRGVGVTGRGRVAWRELDEDEMAEARRLFADGKPTVTIPPADKRETVDGVDGVLSQSEIAQLMVNWIRDNYAVSASDLSQNGYNSRNGKQDDESKTKAFAGCNLSRVQIRLGGEAIRRDYKDVYRMTYDGKFYGFAESLRKRREMEIQQARINQMKDR